MIAYLKLVRFPNVFTAFADIAAGFLIAQAVFSGVSIQSCLLLGISSGCLYLAGMAFNDIADRKEDARDRPERPLPSGAVSLKGALAVAVGLIVLGCASAGLAGVTSLVIAVMLAVSILGYDFVGKRVALLAPLLLGLCRYLNVLLGLSSYPKLDTVLVEGAFWWTLHAPALAIGLYAAGLTAFSAQEEEGRNKGALYAGWVLLLASVAVVFGAVPYLYKWALGPMALLLILLAWRTRNLIREGTPLAAKALVLNGVLGICVVDATLVLGFRGLSGWRHALLIALLMVPAVVIGKLLRQKEA